MAKIKTLATDLKATFQTTLLDLVVANQEVTIECEVAHMHAVLLALRDKPAFAFSQLIDVCAVDYLLYGVYDWETDSAVTDGFSRAVESGESTQGKWDKPRFAVVYHLLSPTKNQRLRLKVFVGEDDLSVPSVHDIWKSALWFEREAYDLYGILFTDHPDLRRILTDYGFIGHPFRKDFPLSGHVEMRYDAAMGKVTYEPVTVEPRVTVPKVIRDDNRYLDQKEVAK
ncbi:MAG: NADH-quinone oxidoreductase subunit C [Gammaproteobacteria bacterium]|nr:NADH-quinone oxidoreductase subunit C [Gammaproteobacteria bacterium]